MGCNTHVHGNNARNLSVYPSLSQASKNAMSFLLYLVFSIHQNWRKGQNKFCLEARGVEEKVRGVVGRGLGWPKQCIHI
jgi:hypothetical protein